MSKRKNKLKVVHRRPPVRSIKPARILLGALVVVFVGGLYLFYVGFVNQLQGFQKEAAVRISKLERQVARSIQTPVAYGAPYRVARVVDGDTLELASGEQLRYIGINTPEMASEQCFSAEATERHRALVEGKEITFYRDVSERDQYGGLLGYAYLADGTFINELLVREGYAFAYTYPPDVSQHVLLKTVEEEAKTASRGLWKECDIEFSHGLQQTQRKRLGVR